MMTSLRKIGALLLVLASGMSGLTFSAARSDFVFRGCPGFARQDWAETANCSDGWFAQWAFGGITVLLLVLSVVLWPRQRVRAT